MKLYASLRPVRGGFAAVLVDKDRNIKWRCEHVHNEPQAIQCTLKELDHRKIIPLMPEVSA